MPPPRFRLLADRNIPVELCAKLRASGHDVRRDSWGLVNSSLLNAAGKERRILLTNDNDFSDTKRYSPKNFFGVILIRIHPGTTPAVWPFLSKFLTRLRPKNVRGKLVILDKTGFEKVS